MQQRQTPELDLFRLYLDEIGRHPLPTRQDEVRLSRAYRAGLRARRTLAEADPDDPARPRLRADTPVGDDGAALQDVLEDEAAVGPDELAVEAVGHQALDQVLAALPDRERQVLMLRFGLDSGTPRTLEEMGAVLGVSRERARQVERGALTKLRSPEIRARLEDLVAG